MRYFEALSAFAFICVATLANADSISLTNGETIKGSILRRDGDSIAVSLDYGVIRYNIGSIKAINGKPVPATAVVATPSPPPIQPNRLPAWRNIAAAISSQPWATGFQQIPATVVDKGVMRNVPYLSFRCGDDYETNIYGDPDNPAGVEIGIYRALLKDEAAKKNCVEFIASVLGDKLQRDVLRVMDRRKSLFEHDGMSLEITPETDEDAYGGWWVSAYKEKALDGARASDAEVAAISTPKVIQPGQAGVADPMVWSSTEMKLARSRSADSPTLAPVTVRSAYVAKPSTPIPLYVTKPATPPPTYISSATPVFDGSSDSGGRVYVRGYFRKNGTYVHSYSRSR